MTAEAAPVPIDPTAAQTPPWHGRELFGHRPLLVLSALMGLGAVASAVGFVVDPRELLGQPLWAKPLKFCAGRVRCSK